MARNVAQKLLASHLVDGELTPGAEVGLRVDQTLTQDATGTMVMLELEAMGLDRIRTELSVQYVDHNLLQTDKRRTPRTTCSCAPPPSGSGCGSPRRATGSPIRCTRPTSAAPARS